MAETGARIEGDLTEVGNRAPLTESELKTIVDSELRASLAYSNSQLSSQREYAMRYFYGEKFGEILSKRDGRSSVVMPEVRNTILWTMPSLMEMLAGSDDVVDYHPKKPGQEKAAEAATDYVNWAFLKNNPGYMILYDWFFSALLQKNGFVKAWWGEKVEETVERYEGLTQEDFAELVADDDVEIMAAESEMVEVPVPEALGGGVALAEVISVQIKRVDVDEKICVEHVAPEDIFVSRWAKSMENCPFIAQRSEPSRTELVEMGFDPDIIYNLPAYNYDETSNNERMARRDYDQSRQETASQSDPSMDKIRVYECYIRVDADRDGRAELLKVTKTETDIIDVEQVDEIPFSDLCPFNVPDKFFGLSMADLVSDLQEIRSTVMRQVLDNMYLTNNARVEVPENIMGDHTLDDLANDVPGGWVRTQGAGGLNQLAVAPVWQAAFPVLDLMSDEREMRTGVTRQNQGRDIPNVNQSGIAVEMFQQAGQQQIKMIAQIFARTGMTRLFRSLLRLAVRHEGRRLIPNPRFDPRMLDDEGQPIDGSGPAGERFIEIDPSTWSQSMDVETRVGMGAGSRLSQISQLQGILAHQMSLRMSGDPELAAVATAQDIYEASEMMVEALGTKGGRKLFTDPRQAQLLAAQGQQEAQAQQAAMMQQMAEMQAQMQQLMIWTKAQADMAEAQQKHEHDVDLENVKSRNRLMLQNDEQAADAQLEGFRAGASG